MPFKILYHLDRVHYRGESIGSDWTFYIHTAAGLSKLEAKVHPGENHYRGWVVAVHPVDGEEGAELIDTWWVSAVEKDQAEDDFGVTSRFRVPLILEHGVEMMRTMTAEVVDTGRNGRRDVAQLDFKVAALVLDSDSPQPDLDATPVPRDARPEIEYPFATAGEFPTRFNAIADGVDPKSVPVMAHKVVELKLGEEPNNPRDQILARFLENFTYDVRPSGISPKIALYQISNRDGIRFWSSQNSSMGIRSQARIIDALNRAVPPLGGGTPRFERGRHNIVSLLLQPKFAGEFGPAATALADLIMVLTEIRPERVSISRDLFTRTVELNRFSGIWTNAFFVEPTPFSGPDPDVWLIVWTDAWEE